MGGSPISSRCGPGPSPSSDRIRPCWWAGTAPVPEDRVLDFGDEWLPQSGPFADIAEFQRRVTALREKAGRAVPVTVFGVPPRKQLLAEFAAAGADRCLLPLTSLTQKDTLESLDEWAGLIE